MNKLLMGKLSSGLQITLRFVGKYWREVAIVILLLVCLMSVKSCRNNQQVVKDLKMMQGNQNGLLVSKMKKWEDKFGQAHTAIKNAQISKEAVGKQLDSVSSLLNIKNKQVQQLSSANVKLELKSKVKVIDTGYQVIACPTDYDSIQVPKSYTFKWSDKYISISGTIGDGVDSINVYGVDTLKRTDYWKRKNWIGAKEHYSDFTHTNPHIELVGFSGIKIREAPKNWSVGIGIGVGYNFSSFDIKKPTLQAGIQVQRTIFRF